MADNLSRVAGRKILHQKMESRFVFETADDERLTRKNIWVHYDEWSRVGVLYLSDPRHSRGGTSFYRHRHTGLANISDALRDESRELIRRDSTALEEWEEIAQIQMRFNRMVLFRPQFFHQASCYFGSSIQDARLYSIIAFGD